MSWATSLRLMAKEIGCEMPEMVWTVYSALAASGNTPPDGELQVMRNLSRGADYSAVPCRLAGKLLEALATRHGSDCYQEGMRRLAEELAKGEMKTQVRVDVRWIVCDVCLDWVRVFVGPTSIDSMCYALRQIDIFGFETEGRPASLVLFNELVALLAEAAGNTPLFAVEFAPG